MSNLINSVRVGFDVERSVAGPFTGSFQTLGSPLEFNPIIVVLDNQSDVSVELSIDGTNTWKTFAAGQSMILDLRANHGPAYNYTIALGEQFYVKGTGGSGSFLLSILYGG